MTFRWEAVHSDDLCLSRESTVRVLTAVTRTRVLQRRHNKLVYAAEVTT